MILADTHMALVAHDTPLPAGWILFAGAEQ